ncbi:hypothetical protein [Echinicola shivajiensis]|uniref:hypothetical protein n=1 Tax=Echinicola shivajiensis TaxID=1035916 RepID=UPI001BFCCB9D|nr:hypothetical protein [Echinicola shivajiensis]
METTKTIANGELNESSLRAKHRSTAEWLSAISFWKKEMDFFQKLLDRYSGSFTSVGDKQKIDHFQNLIIFYNGELLETFKSKVRSHDKRLFNMVKKIEELNREYEIEHQDLMEEMESVNKQIYSYHDELFGFIEKAIK